MSVYVYENHQGGRIEREFPIGTAPRRLSFKRVKYELTICPPKVINVAKDPRHIAVGVPPWTPGAKEYVTDPQSPDYGQPKVTTYREARNIEAATNGKYVYRSRTDR